MTSVCKICGTNHHSAQDHPFTPAKTVLVFEGEEHELLPPSKYELLCEHHAKEREEFGGTGHAVVPEGDCQKCYELSGRDPYDRDMTEPYEP